MATYILDHGPHLLYGLPQFLRRNAELLRPILKLIILVDIDSAIVRRPRLRAVVWHVTSPPMNRHKPKGLMACKANLLDSLRGCEIVPRRWRIRNLQFAMRQRCRQSNSQTLYTIPSDGSDETAKFQFVVRSPLEPRLPLAELDLGFLCGRDSPTRRARCIRMAACGRKELGLPWPR